ncbi:VOC family protein [Rhodococcus sp. NPDC058521]|uniref:VOC family protein n=1 Tax=Rhodococcus sp. NPDC058521 TaxID=3346536 RepID=UPI0036573813
MNTTKTQTIVWPTLMYADARGAIRFLVDVLGFVETAVYGEGDLVEHAELAWPGGGGIMLGSSRPESDCQLPVGVGSIYVVIDNPDELYDRVVKADATITRELRDEDYGSRGFTCRDPEGVFWNFGTYGGA